MLKISLIGSNFDASIAWRLATASSNRKNRVICLNLLTGMVFLNIGRPYSRLQSCDIGSFLDLNTPDKINKPKNLKQGFSNCGPRTPQGVREGVLGGPSENYLIFQRNTDEHKMQNYYLR